jgi:hypothetical protein
MRGRQRNRGKRPAFGSVSDPDQGHCVDPERDGRAPDSMRVRFSRAFVAETSHRGLDPSCGLADDREVETRRSNMYTAFGYLHARVGAAAARLRGQLGQGTVEYVALILLVALVMAGVVAAMEGFQTDEGKELGDIILGKIKDAVKKVEF